MLTDGRGEHVMPNDEGHHSEITTIQNPNRHENSIIESVEGSMADDPETTISRDTTEDPSPRHMISPETCSTFTATTFTSEREENASSFSISHKGTSSTSFSSNPAGQPLRAPPAFPSEEDDFKNPAISTYIKVFVRHSYMMTCLHVSFALVCIVFALPYVNLSTPNAGLRLREDPIGERADGFFSAILEMIRNQDVPTGQVTASPSPSTPSSLIGPAGISAQQQQIQTYERLDKADSLLLVWYTDPPGNVFTPKNVKFISEFENALFNLTSYQEQLCVLQYSGKCLGFWSPMKYITRKPFKPDSDSPEQDKLISDRVKALPNDYLARDFDDNNRVSKYTRSWIPLGGPLPGYHSVFDRTDEQLQKTYDLLKLEVLPKIMSLAYGGRVADDLRLTYDNPYIVEKQAMDILGMDLAYSIVALSLIFGFLWWHMKSIFLAGFGLLQIIMSFPVTLFIYRMLLGVKLFGGLHAIGVFLILGIGVDDCFVFFDALDQANRQFPHRSQMFRMDRAYRSSRYAMFSTSFTTCICFFSLVSCGVPILKYFGVFCALLVAVNYVLVMTFFAGILLIWDLKLRHKPGTKPRRSCCHWIKSCFSPLCRRDRCSCSSGFRRPQVRPMSTRRRSSTSGGSLAKNPHSSGPEKAFIILGENVVTTTFGKTIIIIISLIIIGVLTCFAVQMKPSDSIDSFWAKGHPFRAYEEISAEGFYGDEVQTATIRFVNGMKPPGRINFDYAVDTDMGTPVYDEQFQANSVGFQMFTTTQCDEIRAELGVNPLLYSQNNASTCPMNEFRDWLIAKGRTFPINNPIMFAAAFLEFVLQPYQSAGSSTAFKPMQFYNQYVLVPKFMFNQFPTTRSQRGDDLEQRMAVYEEWDRFSNKKFIEGLGQHGSEAPVDGFYEVWMRTQQILLSSAYSSIGFSIGVAFAVLFFATHGDVYSSAVGTFTLGASVVSTLGAMVLAGWSLGAVEAVACTILCGIAVDYCIHMSIAHAETFFEDGEGNGELLTRNERVVEALRRLGVSVLYGGLTTLVSSGVLMMCTLAILTRFGQFMVMVVVFALVASLVFQMALLSLPVPSRPLLIKRGPKKQPDVPTRPSPFRSIWSISPKVFFFIYSLVLIGMIGGVVARGVTYQIALSQEDAMKQREKAKKESQKNGRRLSSSDALDILQSDLPVFEYRLASVDDLPKGKWSEIHVPSNHNSTSGLSFPTGCAFPGEDYSFFVFVNDQEASPADDDTVYVEFEGRAGSICYDQETCYGENSGSLLQRRIGERDRFKRINTKNDSFPFLMQRTPRMEIYLPYCTADAFLGNVTANYFNAAENIRTDIKRYFDVRHLGQGNVRAAFEWLFRNLQSPSSGKNVIIQGCGTGAVGALAASDWAVPILKNTYKVPSVSLIVDSATLVFNEALLDRPDASVQSLVTRAEQSWSATTMDEILSFSRANATMNGQMLVASSAYDWYQAAIGGFGRKSKEFKAAVDASTRVSPFLLQTNGDRHCVVLNPVKDRFDTHVRVEKVVDAFLKGQQHVPSIDLYYKCSDDNNCEYDADLRFAQ